MYLEKVILNGANCLAGLERDKFDNKTVSFEEHIKSEHSMWHYLYFLVLVRVKDPTEYTGPESYVAQMIAVSTHTGNSHTVPFVMQFLLCTLKAALSSKYCSLSYIESPIFCVCKLNNNVILQERKRKDLRLHSTIF